MHCFAEDWICVTQCAPPRLCMVRSGGKPRAVRPNCRFKSAGNKTLGRPTGCTLSVQNGRMCRRLRHTRCFWRCSMEGNMQAVQAAGWIIPIDRSGAACYDALASSAFPLPCIYYKRSVVPYRVTGPIGPLSSYRHFQGLENLHVDPGRVEQGISQKRAVPAPPDRPRRSGCSATRSREGSVHRWA